MVRAWLFLLCAQVGVARAEGKLGIVNLRFVDVGDQERREWRDAVQRAVEARGLGVVSDANLRYVQSTSGELFDCFTEDRCRTEIGRRLQADLLLSGQISREKDELLGNLALHATDLGTTVKNQVIHCPGCTAAAFRERLGEAVSELITTDRGLQRATLLVRTVPPGAEVRCDGRPVGKAELEVTVVAGAHRLIATHENHDPLEMNVQVKPQERLEVELKLPPRTMHSPPTLPPAPNASWWNIRRIAGVSMMALGAAGLITGIPLLAIDGTCAETLTPPSGAPICYSYHSYTGAGGAFVGLGAALVVVGGVVLLTSRATPAQATLAPVVGPGAVGVVGEVRF
jgi:PEGA domain